MRGFRAILATGFILACGAAFADDGSQLMTGRSVAISGTSGACDHLTPVCATMGKRLVPYDNECRALADGASSVSFSGCFDEN